MKITLLTGKIFDINQQLGFDIKIIKSSQAKRLTLRIDSKEKKPVLTIPNRCSSKKALDFVLLHQDWIKESLQKLPPSKKFEPEETISLMGKKYTLLHCPEKRCGAKIEEDKIIVSGAREFFHRRVCDFCKKTAAKELLKKTKQMAKKIGCHVNSVTIKDTKSRWGSCSTLENINYNWRIVLAPDFVIDYLIAHEVSHLLHQNHSSDFWECVFNLYDQAQAGKEWLKIHGKELYIYE